MEKNSSYLCNVMCAKVRQRVHVLQDVQFAGSAHSGLVVCGCQIAVG